MAAPRSLAQNATGLLISIFCTVSIFSMQAVSQHHLAKQLDLPSLQQNPMH
jgi:hypothetical protein